ncbi:MAG: ACT domain-containing protein [Candidatus Sulfotelmatobacter sp.]|jgi:hypothetical protein
MIASHAQTRPLKFRQLPSLYSIVRQSPNAPVPAWATKDNFTSITRTADELSIVCQAENIPAELVPALRWICLKLEGPFPFSQTGVLLSFIAPLSNNAIPIFAMSTYDTDYVLIPQEHADRALGLLNEAGHELIKD